MAKDQKNIKYLNIHLTKDDTQMANKHMKNAKHPWYYGDII